jgi:hypothetical protein
LRLSLLWGKPKSQVVKEVTAWDMMEYEIADEMGMIPDWKELRQLLMIIGGVDPEDTEPQQPQDMAQLYQQRKARYGR